MKQFIDKLIERLEEKKSECLHDAKVMKTLGKDKLSCFCHAKEEGICDAIRIVNELADEYNNDFCEWKFTKSVADGGYFYSSGCNHKRFSDLHSFEFCPYCGKKIKIAPYQPKGEQHD